MTQTLWETTLTIAVILSTAVTIFICALPSVYSHFDAREVTERAFTAEDRQQREKSGYAYYQKHKDAEGKLRTEATVQVVVLGDIGRSPRMQYHALSIASHGGTVDLIGYVESEVHPDIQVSQFIRVVPIKPFPGMLQTNNRVLFLFLGPLKVSWQVWSLYYAMAYRTRAAKWMLVQNPPSIPTLAVSQLVCYFRKTRLIIDWHNFGYSILAMKLGERHPLVRLSEWYEGACAQGPSAHFAVTNAMTEVLREKWSIEAVALHDRPPDHFQPLTAEERMVFLRKTEETKSSASDIEAGKCRLIISSTSWTPDEDFGLFLEALVYYSAAVERNRRLPNILAIITGKGPLKQHYIDRIQQQVRENRLQHVRVKTAWLSIKDYASLLGSADLGISLHTSSSGVDLPMKAVDMLGTGLPVAGWSKFKAWPELIQEGENGRGFESAEGLTKVLEELFGDDGSNLSYLRRGALKECERRWDNEWMPIAGRLFQLRP